MRTRDLEMTRPRRAKVHSQRLADLYARSGWRVVREFLDDGGHPYEYYLEWHHAGEPIDPIPKVGDLVVMVELPGWVSTLPRESQAVFRFCRGREYRVVEIDSQGKFVLDVSGDVDQRFGGSFNDIRLDLDDLTKAEVVARQTAT